MTAKLWDRRLKSHSSCINTFTGHVSDINSVSWFPDYKSFGTASDDGHCDYLILTHIKHSIFMMEVKWMNLGKLMILEIIIKLHRLILVEVAII